MIHECAYLQFSNKNTLQKDQAWISRNLAAQYRYKHKEQAEQVDK